MRILLLTHRLPYAPVSGDRIRSHHVLRVLAGRFEVDLASLVHDTEEAVRATDLGGLAERVVTAPVPRLANRCRALAALATSRPLTHALLYSPALVPALGALVAERPPDLVLAYCSGMARFALLPPLAGIPFVLDMVDVDSGKWRELSGRSPLPFRLLYAREARTLEGFEARAVRLARTTLVVNERERTALQRIAPGAAIEVVPNGVDLARFAPPGPPSPEPRAVFMGVLDYPPNEEAALRLVLSIWPRVRERRPDASLLLVGSSPTRRLLAAASRTPGVEVTGRVPDVAPHLWRSAVATAPLATARGVQNKVLESIAAGLPAVVTPAVHDGLPPEVHAACRVAPDDEGLAREILALLEMPPGSRRATARRASLDALTWEVRLADLPAILERAGREAVV